MLNGGILSGADSIVTSSRYDSKGNKVSGADSILGTSVLYDYDVENRMIKAALKAGDAIVSTQENWYNGNEQRIGKMEVTEADTDNPAAKNFLGLEDNAIATTRYSGAYAGQNYFYLKDIRGSVSSVVGSTMEGVTSYEYNDFGITTINGDENFENQICYTGGIYDEMTGLYYLNARYYDPETGRFLTEDTYRGEQDDAGTWHQYVYCVNNPINYTTRKTERNRNLWIW